MEDNTQLQRAFGNVLREIRRASQISQEQLAFIAGLDRTYISLLERGLRQPTLGSLFALAEALDTIPSKIVGDVEGEILRLQSNSK